MVKRTLVNVGLSVRMCSIGFVRLLVIISINQNPIWVYQAVGNIQETQYQELFAEWRWKSMRIKRKVVGSNTIIKYTYDIFNFKSKHIAMLQIKY